MSGVGLKKGVVGIVVCLLLVISGMLIPTSVLAKPIHVRVSDVTSSSFTVTWVNSDGNEVGTVRYDTDPAFGSPTDVSDSGGDNVHRITITGLSSGTTYYFRVYSEGQWWQDSDGDGNPDTGYAVPVGTSGSAPWSVYVPNAGGTPGTPFTVYGHVYDINNNDATNVVVHITETSTGYKFSNLTDSNGQFVITLNISAQGKTLNVSIDGAEKGCNSTSVLVPTSASSPYNLGDFYLHACEPAHLAISPKSASVPADGTSKVTVHFWVNDTWGNPVTGLTSSDFTFTFDNSPAIGSWDVSSFTEVGNGEYTVDYVAGTSTGTDIGNITYKQQFMGEYVYNTTTITLTTPVYTYYFHVEPPTPTGGSEVTVSADGNLSKDEPNGNNGDGQLQTYQVDVSSAGTWSLGTWLRNGTYGQDTNVSGTWTFHAWVNGSSDLQGHLYAEIYTTNGGSKLGSGESSSFTLSQTTQKITWNANVPEWADQRHIIPAGYRFYVKLYFNSTNGWSAVDEYDYVNQSTSTWNDSSTHNGRQGWLARSDWANNWGDEATIMPYNLSENATNPGYDEYHYVSSYSVNKGWIVDSSNFITNISADDNNDAHSAEENTGGTGGTTTETRYMRSDQQTVNGLTAYILGTTQTASSLNSLIERTGGGGDTVEWGIRVWKRDSAGTETEITAGTPVAIVSRSSNGEGIQSNTWDCPGATLASTDVIVVRVYAQIVGQVAWTEQATFVTEQLGATSLDAVTWTVYYYTRYATRTTGPSSWRYTRGWFYWGDSTYNSRIENFQWSAGASPNYEYDIIYDITGVPTDADTVDLEYEYYISGADNENFNITVYNWNTGNWEELTNDLTSTSRTTVTESLTPADHAPSGTVRIRVIGMSESSDNTNTSLYFDYIRVHCIKNPNTYKLYSDVNITGIATGPAMKHVVEIFYNYTSGEGERVVLYFWNYTSNSWDEFGPIAHVSAWTLLSIDITAQGKENYWVSSSGHMGMLFCGETEDSSDTTNTTIWFDYIRVHCIQDQAKIYLRYDEPPVDDDDETNVEVPETSAVAKPKITVYYDFVQGYNLFSFNITSPDVTTASALMARIDAVGGAGSCDMIAYWDQSIKDYVVYTSGGTDFEIKVGYGYWVHCTKAVNNVNFEGYAPKPGTNSYSLNSGWTMLGWVNDTAVSPQTYASYISTFGNGGNQDLITGWNHSAQEYYKIPYIYGLPFSPSWNVEPHYGYWVRVNGGTIDY